MIEYNIAGGKKTRSASMLSIYKALTEKSTISNRQDMDLARKVAWTLELLQGCYCISDDMVDEGEVRRNKLCWHRKVGMKAMNDAIIMLAGVNQALRVFCADHPCYTDMIHLYNDTTCWGYMGQNLDLATIAEGKKGDLSSYTWDRMEAIGRNKTFRYTFVLPFRLGIFLAGIKDPHVHQKASEIGCKIGLLFGIQDDYMDYAVDPKIMGKIPTDIPEAKCTWPVLMALKHGSKEQMQQLKANLGKDGPECIKKVRDVYDQISLSELFLKEEKIQKDECEEMITKYCYPNSILPKEPFLNLLHKLIGRKI